MSTKTPSVRSIFDSALDIASEAERRVYVEQACAGWPEMRQQVDALLRAHCEAGSFLQSPPVAVAVEGRNGGYPVCPILEGPGTRIGPYKLLQQIGEGGFGVVYLAEQLEPVRRKVALKIIKPGMDTKEVVARFESERQALALMDHPSIARVFDAGATESGRPYFVMELVKGIPITEFCDDSDVSATQRLELFIEVCHAVQHAHQKGVIHRDLKPSNVMVALHDSRPVPKVIDFGVAKATSQQLTERTLFTAYGQMIGTPAYMSPEQAQLNALDVDTRSDVYSLGVLLYELLTGTTPFDKDRLKSAGFDEMRRIIREEEPETVSTRLARTRRVGSAHHSSPSAPRSTPGHPRGGSAPRLNELDWIVMKCLEKDRSRRYESASSLAVEIERHLHDEPVQACPPSALYRFRKFAGRNKRILGTAATVAVALLLAVGSLGWMMRDRAARRIETELRMQSAVEEAIRLRDQRRWADARTAARRAEAFLALGENHADWRRQLRDVSADLDMVDRLEMVRLAQTEVKNDWWDHAGADPAYAAAFRDYGIGVANFDVAAAAERVRASAIREQLVAALDDWIFVIRNEDGVLRERVRSIADLADPDDWRRRFRDPAIQRNRKALEELASRKEVESLPPSTIVLLGRCLQTAGAGGMTIEVLASGQRRFPTDFWLNMELARMLRWLIQPPRIEDAVGYCRAALAIRPDSAGAWMGLATSLRMPHHADEAIAALRKAIDLAPGYASAHHQLGRALQHKSAWTEAAASFREAIRLNPAAAILYQDLGLTLRQDDDLPEAVEAFRQGLALQPGDVNYWGYLAAAHLAMGDRAAHRQVCADMVNRFAETKDPQAAYLVVHHCVAIRDACDDPQQLLRLGYLAASKEQGRSTLGAALCRAGEYDAALLRLEEGNPRGIWNLLFRAMAHHHLGHDDQARDCLQQAQGQSKSTQLRWPLDMRTEQLRREVEALIERE